MAFDATDFIPAKVDPLTITDPRERLKYLAGFLRELREDRFDMAAPGKRADAESGECGSAACIGGWARAKFRCQDAGDIIGVGRKLFGLSQEQEWDLFFPGDQEIRDGRNYYDATPRQAAQVIDHLLLTGEVDWGVAS